MKTLEDKSLWYKYKVDVMLTDTPQSASVHNIMRSFRSVHNRGEFAYASTPITTCRDYYLQEYDPDKLFAQNYLKGYNFVESLEKRVDCPILFPADLTPARQTWEQPHFMVLWLTLIGESVTEMHLNEGWEYSSGCVEEFVHVQQLKLGLPTHKDLLFFNTKRPESAERERMKSIAVYSHDGQSLSLEQGKHHIQRATREIKSMGHAPTRLEKSIDLLKWTEEMIKKGFYQ